ncbi:signal peptidase I [Desulfurococcaceae archaeon MEX13E-LK6-19]|nr:signal peptidase I [Desulfurococcaceae archaeon MEX13E-LK6-19]
MFFIAIVIIILATRFIILPAVTGTDVPIAVVEGKSMFPLLREGDIVFIKKVSPEDIHVGDVIVYEYRGKYIIHRVIKVIHQNGKTYYVTKGDNNFVIDPYYEPGVPYDKVKGKVVEIGDNTVLKIPYIGYYTLWINK